MVKFFKVLLVFIMLSCEGTSNHQAAKTESFVFLLWVTKVDVCSQVLSSAEQRKVLFIMNEGVFAFALSDSEKLVLNYDHLYQSQNPLHAPIKLFRSDPFQELYRVEITVAKSGLLIFVTPVILITEPCTNRINTTAYIFSTTEPMK